MDYCILSKEKWELTSWKQTSAVPSSNCIALQSCQCISNKKHKPRMENSSRKGGLSTAPPGKQEAAPEKYILFSTQRKKRQRSLWVSMLNNILKPYFTAQTASVVSKAWKPVQEAARTYLWQHRWGLLLLYFGGCTEVVLLAVGLGKEGGAYHPPPAFIGLHKLLPNLSRAVGIHLPPCPSPLYPTR